MRYVLRRNPVRAAEIRAARDNQLAAPQRLVAQQHAYLAAHPQATIDRARERVLGRGGG